MHFLSICRTDIFKPKHISKPVNIAIWAFKTSEFLDSFRIQPWPCKLHILIHLQNVLHNWLVCLRLWRSQGSNKQASIAQRYCQCLTRGAQQLNILVSSSHRAAAVWCKQPLRLTHDEKMSQPSVPALTAVMPTQTQSPTAFAPPTQVLPELRPSSATLNPTSTALDGSSSTAFHLIYTSASRLLLLLHYVRLHTHKIAAQMWRPVYASQHL